MPSHLREVDRHRTSRPNDGLVVTTANPGWALTAWPGFFAAERRTTPKRCDHTQRDTKPKPAPREELAKVNRRETFEVPTVTDPQGLPGVSPMTSDPDRT